MALFFMLSGYWVTRLYIERSGSRLSEYLLDRILRVWPLLALAAVSTVALYTLLDLPYSGSLTSTLALLGLASRHGDVIGVAWSLDIELQFYVVLPFALWMLGRVPPPLQATAAVIAIAILFMLGILASTHGLATVLLWSPAFAAGAVIYLAQWRVSTASAGLSVAAFAGLMLTPWLRPLLIKSDATWLDDPILVIACLSLMPFVAWNLRQPSNRFDRHIGNLSFPFYLVHFPIVHAMTSGSGYTIKAKAVAFAISAIASIIVYAAIDRPLDVVRKSLVDRAFRNERRSMKLTPNQPLS